MNKRELMEKRAKAVAEMRAITDKPAGEAGDLSAEQQQQFDAMKAEVRALDKAIERAEFLEQAERREQGTQISGTGDRDFTREIRSRYSLLRAIAGRAGLPVDDGFEKEVEQETRSRSGASFQGLAVPLEALETRVLTTELPSGGAGGNLVPTEHGPYQDALRAKMVLPGLGATVISGLVGNLDLPAHSSSVTASWIAENAAVSASDMQFGKIQMTPKHVAALSEISRNMVLQTSPDVERIIRMDMGAVLARAIESAAINGGGSNEPSGILQGSINSVTFSGSAPTWAEILEFIEQIELDDAEGRAWITTPSMVKVLRSTPKELDGSSAAVSADYLASGPRELAGYPLRSSTLVPSTLGGGSDHALIFGDFSHLMIAYWGGLDILVNPFESTAFSKGNIQIRAMLTCDVALRHDEAFCSGNLTIS